MREAARSVELVTLQFEGGVTDFNRVFNAQSTLVTQQDQLAVAGNIALQAVAVYRALGGGWLHFLAGGGLPAGQVMQTEPLPPATLEEVPVGRRRLLRIEGRCRRQPADQGSLPSREIVSEEAGIDFSRRSNAKAGHRLRRRLATAGGSGGPGASRAGWSRSRPFGSRSGRRRPPTRSPGQSPARHRLGVPFRPAACRSYLAVPRLGSNSSARFKWQAARRGAPSAAGKRPG